MWKRGRSIIAAAKEDWLLKFSQNIRLVLADDENRSPEHYAIHLDEDEARSEWNTIRLDRKIEDSTLAMACVLDYAKIQGAPITAKNMHTWANFREAVNANDQACEAIKKAYQQLAALMASYNIHMQQAVNEAEQGICLKPERNFGRGQRNVFAGSLIWRELADKYDGVDQAARDDLATKLTRAVAIDISAMQAADVDNWLLTIHSCILALQQRKTSEEVIESAATAPVLEALQSVQDRQDGMCQAEWCAIGKKAAQYYELRRSALSADNSKCTWDVVYVQLSKTCVAARIKA